MMSEAEIRKWIGELRRQGDLCYDAGNKEGAHCSWIVAGALCRVLGEEEGAEG